MNLSNWQHCKYIFYQIAKICQYGNISTDKFYTLFLVIYKPYLSLNTEI